jgi:Domain of unknown function (DUF4382)/Carboxypeptidase regulatory-like domain
MKKSLLIIFATTLILSACSKTGDQSNLLNSGKIIIKVTDDPFNMNYVESATVTITKIEIRKAGGDDSIPFIVLSNDSVTLDLTHLRNGITQTLLNLEIPQGKYDLIRLYVDRAGLKIKDQPTAFNLKVPSGKQTGIKLFIIPSLTVEGGLTSELVLDFDLSRSFVMRGNMNHSAGINGFIFKPCIRVSNISTSGRIVGMVSDTSKVNVVNAKIWVMQDTILSTSFSDTLGNYAFIGVPAGIYSVFATKENYDTVKYSGIQVTSGNLTIQNFILTKK